MSPVVLFTITFELTTFRLLKVIEHFCDICSEFSLWWPCSSHHAWLVGIQSPWHAPWLSYHAHVALGRTLTSLIHIAWSCFLFLPFAACCSLIRSASCAHAHRSQLAERRSCLIPCCAACSSLSYLYSLLTSCLLVWPYCRFSHPTHAPLFFVCPITLRRKTILAMILRRISPCTTAQNNIDTINFQINFGNNSLRNRPLHVFTTLLQYNQTWIQHDAAIPSMTVPLSATIW
jgi:hypothetical protein